MLRVYFATDVHGSDICWKKFLAAAAYYKADVLVLGGDMTGKAIVPLVLSGGRGQAVLLGSSYELDGQEAILDFEKQVRSRGYYPVRLSPDERDELAANPELLARRFEQAVCDTLSTWLDLAAERLPAGVQCYVCPGNDDPFAIDGLLAASDRVVNAEGRFIDIGGFYLASSGWTNPSPWHTCREEGEDALAERLASILAAAPPDLAMAKKGLFNFHCPPYSTGLDDAPELTADLSVKHAGQSTVPVGSTAVRAAIERCRPLVSMHGHIHEAKGVCRIGKTLAVNPGSLYEQGVLQGLILDLDPRRGLKNYVLTTG